MGFVANFVLFPLVKEEYENQFIIDRFINVSLYHFFGT